MALPTIGDFPAIWGESFAFTAALVAATSVVVLSGLATLGYRTAQKEQMALEQLILVQTNSESVASETKAAEPFEITALARYYKQALSRAIVSFWFSIIFASIGFAVILFAFVSHSGSDIAGTAIKVASGTVIDAISILFFVQSTNAQRSMGEFFEKLRLDRLNAEAREMIGEIESALMRDQLRSQLILKYSGIDKLLDGTHRAD